MNRINSLLDKLSLVAKKSNFCHQHGAVLLKNGVPIHWGYNQVIGGYVYHAEQSVLRAYLKSCGFKHGSHLLCKQEINKCFEWY